MPLDLVEVAKSHSGPNLAAAFAKVLEDFGISDRVSIDPCSTSYNADYDLRFSVLPATMHQTMTP
jgi:hypothetical protein